MEGLQLQWLLQREVHTLSLNGVHAHLPGLLRGRKAFEIFKLIPQKKKERERGEYESEGQIQGNKDLSTRAIVVTIHVEHRYISVP